MRAREGEGRTTKRENGERLLFVRQSSLKKTTSEIISTGSQIEKIKSEVV